MLVSWTLEIFPLAVIAVRGQIRHWQGQAPSKDSSHENPSHLLQYVLARVFWLIA
jgi:hypothetical protein